MMASMRPLERFDCVTLFCVTIRVSLFSYIFSDAIILDSIFIFVDVGGSHTKDMRVEYCFHDDGSGAAGISQVCVSSFVYYFAGAAITTSPLLF
jgi:hypothetical protein